MTYLLSQPLILLVVGFLIGVVLGLVLGRSWFGGDAQKVEADRAEARRDATQARALLDGANSKATLAQGELAEARKALVALKAERDAAIDDAPFEALRLKHDVLVQRLQEAETALVESKSRCNDLRAERSGLSERILALEAALAARVVPASSPPEEPASPASEEPASPPPEELAPQAAVAAAGLIAVVHHDEPVVPDDLRKIEGIGPKIQRLLRDNGVLTFRQLAEADVEVLRSYVMQGGKHMKVHDPAPWPARAALAAEGRWDDLRQLQKEASAGR